MSIDFKKKTVVPEHVLFRELEGESVLLNIETETYFGLDSVGTRIWEVLSEAESIQTAYESLLEEFDVEPDVLRSDLMELAKQLVEKGLIETIDAT